MSSRPNTPSARRTTPTATSSPTKPPSLNNTASRPSSSLSNHPRKPPSTSRLSASPTKSTSTSSSTSTAGRASPTKRSSAVASQLRPSSSTSTLRGQPSSSSLRSRTSKRDLLFDSDDGDSDDGDERDVPVRRAGFGAAATRAKAIHEETTDDEDRGFMTCKESSTSLAPSSSAGDDYEGEEEEGEQEDQDGKAVNVVVCLRVRPTRSVNPPPSIYAYKPTASSLSFASSHPVILKRGAMSTARQEEYDYHFDALHLPPKQTEELYEKKIRPVVRAAMRGFNGTVFAYGQTASGKTHTMMGSQDEPGIIPLAIDELFSFIHQQDTTRSYTLRVSFLEIYNEQLRDLLLTPSTSTATKVKPLEIVGEDGSVKGLEERPVSLPSEILALLHEGDLRRRTGATDWNERSSRSHSVFVVTIESTSNNGEGVARTSRLNLIDLAGSESATGQDERRKEGSFINKSLLTLGTVIGKLSEQSASKSSSREHIPYRDSKLTRLLQPALSGKSRVAVICTMSPDVEQAVETLSTLKFAKRAKMVVTKAERGVLMTPQLMMKMYQSQVESLQTQIAAHEASELARERDLAARRADESEERWKKAQEANAVKDLELARLRSQLEHTNSFILTGPVLEANARRVSFGGPAPTSPVNSRRVASEMSALGLGTPRGARSFAGRLASASGAGIEQIPEWEGPKGPSERELELERLLSEANVKLSSLEEQLVQATASSVSLDEEELSTLRSQVSQLQRTSSLARIDAEKSAASNSDRKERVRALEAELASAKDDLEKANSTRAEVGSKLDDMRTELEQAQARGASQEEERKTMEQDLAAANDERARTTAELAKVHAELTTTAASLASLQQEQVFYVAAGKTQLSDAQTRLVAIEKERSQRIAEVEEKDRAMSDLKSQLKVVTQQLAVKTADGDARDKHVASLERQVEAVKQELATTLTTHTEAVEAACARATQMQTERDLVAEAERAAKEQIDTLEELRQVEQQRHDEVESQTQREKSAALSALEAEVNKLSSSLEASDSKTGHLQRLVDSYEKAAADKITYETTMRAGTDGLRARLAVLQGHQTPTSAASSSSTSSVFSRSSSIRLSAGKELETVGDLQQRNAQLVARIQELEKLLADLQGVSRSGTPVPALAPSTSGRFAGRRVGSIDLSRKDSIGDMREKEKLQEQIDEQSRLAKEGRAEADEYRKKYLSTQKLLDKLTAVDSSSLVAASNNDENDPSSLRASLVELHLPTNSAAPSYSRSSSSSRTPHASSAAAPTRPPHSPQVSYSKNVPPPLPYSPRNLEKERKIRRETIAKDMERLKQAKVTESRREGFDSPTLDSPRKGRFEDAPALPTRGKKQSWE